MMNRLRLAYAGLATLALAGAAQAADIGIRLHAQAEPQVTRYTLGDVAEIDGADASLAAMLSSIEVGVTPRIDHAQSVPRQAIAQRVERDHPQLRGSVHWQGAEAVVVRGGGVRLDVQAMQRLAHQTLVEALEQRAFRSEVRAEGRLEDVRVPQGARMSARLAENWSPARRMCVWVDVEVDGRGYRSIPVWFTVKALRQVHVARQNLRAGEVLRAEDLGADWVDAATLASTPLAADVPLTGLRLRHAVDAGGPLLVSAVETRPAVLRNQPVEVQLVLGAVRLQAAGIALRDARLGEMVMVRNLASNELFGALVVAEGTVRVDER